MNSNLPYILIVDDDQRNIFAIEESLEDVEAELLTANSGEAALSIATTSDLALILLDVQMPGMDGFEMAEILSKNSKTSKIPIIFVTAINKEASYARKGHEVGAVDYMCKPIDPVILKAKVNVFIRFYNQNVQMESLVSELNDAKRKLEKNNDSLDKLAHIDNVTQLPNRLMFDESLNNILEESKKIKAHFAVLFLDLDNFKTVNDTYGHDVGDRLLKEASRRMLLAVREDDFVHAINNNFVSRFGGDEFAIVLKDIDKDDNAGIVADRIIKMLSEPFVMGDVTASVGVSIGIACYPKCSDTAEGLVNAADSAMYDAKVSGKNRYRYSKK